MRAPSLLSHCLPGLAPHDQGSHSMSSVSERDVHLPSPAVEIIPSKTAHPYKYAGENVDLQGINVFKGRISVADIISSAGSEMISSKHDGLLKCWDSSVDLLNVLKHEVRDGQMSFRGKRVLESKLQLRTSRNLRLSEEEDELEYEVKGGVAEEVISVVGEREREEAMGKVAERSVKYGGAATVHFQDLNAETIRCTTIPNVLANLEQARDRQSRQLESPLTPSRQTLAPAVHFFAGDWEELPTVLSVVRNDGFEVPKPTSLSFSEEDFMDGSSSQDGSIVGHESSSRRSRKLSGSRAWERASETDQGEEGYDVILMAEIPYSFSSLKKLYALIKKCLRPPYGILFLAAKKNYVGVNSAARHLRSLVDEEGIFGTHLVKEMSDREIWKFFLR
ncbi:unnamed protein product [Camellia sinensis]